MALLSTHQQTLMTSKGERQEMSGLNISPEIEKQFAEQRRRNAEQLQRENAQKAALQASLAASRQREEEAKWERQQQTFDAQLEASFFAANPTATAEDWQRLKGSFRDQYMMQQAQGAASSSSVFDRIRQEAAQKQQADAERQSRLGKLAGGA